LYQNPVTAEDLHEFYLLLSSIESGGKLSTAPPNERGPVGSRSSLRDEWAIANLFHSAVIESYK